MSPVVAVILMVAITVILSAVIGTFVLNLGQQTVSDSPQQDIGVSTSYSNGQYTVTIVTGSADEVQLLVNGSLADNETNISAGDSLSASVSPGATVTLVNTGGESSTVIMSTTVSEPATASTSPIPSDGLVAAWLFDDSSTTGTAVDETGTYDGLISKATYATGVSDTALSFNGDNSSVNVSSVGSELNATNAFTITGWFRVDNLDNFKVAYGKRYYSDGSEARFWFEPNRNEAKGWGVSGSLKDSSGTQHKFVSNYTVNAGQWYHLAWTWDGENATIYVNGTSVYTEQTSGVTAVIPDKNLIGAYDGAGGSKSEYPGDIDELYVYNRSLSSDEVSDIYNATK